MDVNYNVTYGNENELKCTGNINSENETGNESEKHEEESLKKDQAKLSEIRELGNTNMTGPDNRQIRRSPTHKNKNPHPQNSNTSYNRSS